MTRSVHRWRVGAGVGVLLALALVAGALTPPYFANMRFQRYLDEVVETAASAEVLRAQIVSKAAQMDLPVRVGDVRVRRRETGFRVEIVYVVRVDLPLYTVDLHFHPAAGS